MNRLDEPCWVWKCWFTFGNSRRVWAARISCNRTRKAWTPTLSFSKVFHGATRVKNILSMKWRSVFGSKIWSWPVEIDYRCSEAPTSQISLLGNLLFDAVQSGHQWKWERNIGVRSTTDCLNALIPKDRSQDISITLLVSYEKGLDLIKLLKLKPR